MARMIPAVAAQRLSRTESGGTQVCASAEWQSTTMCDALFGFPPMMEKKVCLSAVSVKPAGGF